MLIKFNLKHTKKPLWTCLHFPYHFQCCLIKEIVFVICNLFLLSVKLIVQFNLHETYCIHLQIFSNLLLCLVRCLCKYLWVCPLKPNKKELLKFKAKHNKRNKLGKYFFFLARDFFVNFWLRVLLKIATYYSVGARASLFLPPMYFWVLVLVSLFIFVQWWQDVFMLIN